MLGEGLGGFDGVEVLALDVLDQRDFQEPVIGDVLDDDRDVREAGEFRGAPAALSRDQLESVTDAADDERLDDSVGPNGLG